MIVSEKVGDVKIEVGVKGGDDVTLTTVDGISLIFNCSEWQQVKAIVDKAQKFLNQCPPFAKI